MDLSIIIPTFKTGCYFKEALESIIKQSRTNFKIEIIVVLNGCKDPYFEFLNSFDVSFNYKVLYTDVKGVSNARNLGIEQANGKYILFLDDDDLLSNNYIEKMLSKALEENTIYVSNVSCFKDDYGEKKYYKDYIGKFIDICKDLKQNHFSIVRYSKLMSSSCFKLIPKKIIENERFNTKLSISEDALFMFAISSNIENVVLVEDVFYYRRVRKNSAMKVRKSNMIHIKNYLKFINNLTSIYVKNIFKLNFWFYLNRFLASTKFLSTNLER